MRGTADPGNKTQAGAPTAWRNSTDVHRGSCLGGISVGDCEFVDYVANGVTIRADKPAKSEIAPLRWNPGEFAVPFPLEWDIET